MLRGAIAAAALVLLPTVGPGEVSAQDPGNLIRGKVRNEQGMPIAQVIVIIATGTGVPVEQKVTNAEGDFFASGLTGATYVVSVNQPDYQPLSERVEFTHYGSNRPGETQFVVLTLLAKERTGAATRTGVVFVQNVPQTARDAFDRAMRLGKEGKSDEAIAALKEAIAAFPKYFDAHFALATALLRLEQLDAATRELEEAREINPNDDRVFAAFGMLLSRQRKFAVSAAAFGEAARLKPTEPQYHLMRAAALIDYTTVAEEPKAADAAMRTQMLAAAESELARADAISGKPIPACRLQRARLYERRGQKRRAADELETYLKEMPDAPNAAAIRDSIAKLRT